MPPFAYFGNLIKSRRKPTRRLSHRRRRVLEPLEDRRLLANLNFLASGQVIYGGGGTIDNDLTIAVSGNTYTYTDNSETINIIGLNQPGTSSGSGTNTVTFDATTVGVPLTRLVVNTNAGNDTVSVSGIRGGAEGLEIRAVGSPDTVNITGSLGTAGNRIATYGANISASQINLGGDIFSNGVDVILGAPASATPITLTGNSELDAGAATVQINGSTSGAGNNLTADGTSVQVLGDIALTGAANISLNATDLLQVGTSTNNAALSSGSGNISLSAGAPGVILTDSVSTTGAVTITAADTSMGDAAGVIAGSSVTVSGSLTNISGNLTDISASPGNVSIGGQLSSTSGVSVFASGNANFDNTVSATNIGITAATVNATSLQAGAGNVNVSGATTFDGGAAALVSATGFIRMLGSITGDTNNLRLQAPVQVQVTGAISNVGTLRVGAAGGAAVATAQLDDATARNILINGTAIELSGDLAATGGTGGSVNLTGAVEVGGAALSIISGGDAAESILITGTVDGAVADTTALTLNAGSAGDLAVTGAVGATTRLASLALRGDTVTMQAINVETDLTVNGGNIRLQGAVTGSGTGAASFAPATPGNTLDIFNDPAATRVGNNTRIASDTLANIAGGAFSEFQFGDAATGIVTVNPDADNSISTGTLDLTTPTTFEAGAIIVSEDLDQGSNTVTFETDNLAIYRAVAGTGDVDINKKTAGGTLELRGNIGADTDWGANDIMINAVGGTVNAPAAGAALPVLGLGTNQPQVNLGNSSLTGFTINASTLNALATSAIVSGGHLALNVDTINLVGGVQTTGAGAVTIGNVGATVENIGGGPLSILLPAGSDLSLANYDGNGGSLNIRGVGGQLDDVTLDLIADSGAVSVGTSASNDATTLNVTDDITASSIVLRGDAINLDGILTSTSGNVHLLGPVTLTGHSELNLAAGALATSQVIVNGTIDGAFGLDIDAGGTRVVSLTGAVGGTTDLDSISIISGGVNFLTVPIEVTNGFSWVVGTAGNNVNDRIIRAGAGSITSTNGPIMLTADVLQGIIGNVNVIGPGQTLTERGAGD